MKRSVKPARLLFCLCVCIFSIKAVWAQPLDFEVSHSVDWVQREISSQVSFELAQAGIRLPTGRVLGEDILRDVYPGLLRTTLLSLRLDSGSTIGDMVNRGEISLAELDMLCLEARQTPPSLSPDLQRMAGRYTLFLEKIGALFIRHRRAIEPERVLIPAPAANYTGIIIIAHEELPLRGRRTQAKAEPCLFPKIWDTDMTLIYEKNMFDPQLREERPMIHYAAPESIFQATPSGLDGNLASLLGPNPLRIIAREAFGISPTDLVIDRSDALVILSSENNRRLLREGRVLFVLSEEMLN